MTQARTLDALVGEAPGPTLVVVGGMHGNEPAGLHAARVVFERLRGASAALRGEVIALCGNLRALAEGRRAIVQDLNRMWSDAELARSRATEAPAAEVAEQVELADALETIRARARGPLYLLDLHTTSAPGVPFVIVGPTAADRDFSRALPLPGIVGLEALLEGVLTSWMHRHGFVALAVEGGQSGTDEAAANLEAVLTIALVACGTLDEPAGDGLADARARLASSCGDLPQLIEVVSRHALAPGHRFRMEPGFANIHRTPAGTLLARDGDLELRAHEDGFVLLPLYQPEGRDGYFYGRVRA